MGYVGWAWMSVSGSRPNDRVALSHLRDVTDCLAASLVAIERLLFVVDGSLSGMCACTRDATISYFIHRCSFANRRRAG